MHLQRTGSCAKRFLGLVLVILAVPLSLILVLGGSNTRHTVIPRPAEVLLVQITQGVEVAVDHMLISRSPCSLVPNSVNLRLEDLIKCITPGKRIYLSTYGNITKEESSCIVMTKGIFDIPLHGSVLRL